MSKCLCLAYNRRLILRSSCFAVSVFLIALLELLRDYNVFLIHFYMWMQFQVRKKSSHQDKRHEGDSVENSYWWSLERAHIFFMEKAWGNCRSMLPTSCKIRNGTCPFVYTTTSTYLEMSVWGEIENRKLSLATSMWSHTNEPVGALTHLFILPYVLPLFLQSCYSCWSRRSFLHKKYAPVLMTTNTNFRRPYPHAAYLGGKIYSRLKLHNK